MKNRVNSWRELGTYKSAFELQQRIFEVSKSWPREENYSLTDQIRRSSRSIGANIEELLKSFDRILLITRRLLQSRHRHHSRRQL